MICIEGVTACFSKCCGESNKEDEELTTEPIRSFQSTYTVRRISSFGQTITDETGGEKEIERHSSIVLYDGRSAPWSSKPAPIQPGVTALDVRKQVNQLPPLPEHQTKQKPKQRWKKTVVSSKKEVQFSDLRKYKYNVPQNIQLKAQKFQEIGDTDKHELNVSSHENLFSMCTTKMSEEDNSTGKYLNVPGQLMKSVSTPDLGDRGISGMSKKQNFEAMNELSKPSVDIAMKQSQISYELDKELAAEKLAKEHGLDLALYTNEALNESIKSFPGSHVQTWVEEPVGTLVLSIEFNALQKMFNANIISLASLSGMGLENKPFPLIIKLTLTGSKKYTKVSKRIEAEWRTAVNQSFSFLIKDMDFRSLRISVYNADYLGKHDAVAYGFLSLQDLLEKSENTQLKLYSQPNYGPEVALMQITFGYDGILFTVTVNKIFNYDLKISKCKVYTKIAFYSLSRKAKERLSSLVWSEESGKELWINQSATFRVEPSGRKHSYIMITLKRGENHGVFKPHETLGRMVLGPSFYYQDRKQLTPWGLAIIKKQTYCFSFKLY